MIERQQNINYNRAPISVHTKISYTMEEAGNDPAATHVQNMQRREEDCTLAIRIKKSKEIQETSYHPYH